MAAINQHLGFDATPEDIRKILDAAKYEGQLTRDKLIEIVTSAPAEQWKKLLGKGGDAAAPSKPKPTAEEKREKILAESRARNAGKNQEKPARQPRKKATEAVDTDGEDPPTNLNEGVVSGGAKDLGEMNSDELFEMARLKRVEEGMSFGDQAGYVNLKQMGATGADPTKFEGVKGFGDAVPATPAQPQATPPAQPSPQQTANPQQPSPDSEPLPPLDKSRTWAEWWKTPGLAGKANNYLYENRITPRGVAQTVQPYANAFDKTAKVATVLGVAGGGTAAALKGIAALRGESKQPEDMNALMEQAIAAERNLQARFGRHGEASPITIPADIPRKPEDTIRKAQEGR